MSSIEIYGCQYGTIYACLSTILSQSRDRAQRLECSFVRLKIIPKSGLHIYIIFQTKEENTCISGTPSFPTNSSFSASLQVKSLFSFLFTCKTGWAKECWEAKMLNLKKCNGAWIYLRTECTSKLVRMHKQIEASSKSLQKGKERERTFVSLTDEIRIHLKESKKEEGKTHSTKEDGNPIQSERNKRRRSEQQREIYSFSRESLQIKL